LPHPDEQPYICKKSKSDSDRYNQPVKLRLPME
jgi:hypothetical protein